MLLLLVWWAALLAVALPLGAALLALTGSDAAWTGPPEDRLIAFAWCGLFLLSDILLAVSLFTALRPAVGLTTMAVCALIALATPAVRAVIPLGSLSRGTLATLGTLFVAAAFNASGPTMLYDTGLYHYPLLRWLAEAGTVPGMALVHFRFGFSSSWLALAAATDFGPGLGRSAGVTGGLAFALLLFQFTNALRRVAARTAQVADRFVVLAFPLFFAFALVQRQQVSPSPNLPAAAGVLLSCWLLLQARSDSVACWNRPMLLAAGAASCKLLAAPALAVTMFARLLAAPSRRRIVAPILVCALFLVPLVAANYVASGCPLYPAPLACSDTAAAVAPATATAVSFEVTTWARYVGFAPPGATFASLDWIPSWLKHIWNAVFLAAIGLGILGAFRSPLRFWPYLLGFAGAAYVMVSAPDLRFAIGYAAALVGLACLGVPAARQAFLEGPAPGFWTAAALVVLLADAGVHEFVYYRVLHEPAAAPRIGRLLTPPLLPGVQTRDQSRNGVAYRKPIADDRCWATPRVCTPYPPVASLHLCDAARGEAAGYCK